ncbi:hypothetical protein FA95DRAFT_1502731 [Auriscalpium vulgare]|uniref:Uncharacterized protein n=1 Tax=Auriscalpium vulgare TaxID=40419 RepID=A0ACB8R9E7_9AGAM|nr:hypothetical protein FA95DRAFT_1502731 [Auriscalpium vulgare]
MVGFAVQYKAAIDRITAEKSSDLRPYELSEEEWDIAQELCDVLKDATLFFSRSTPNLSTVIPAMDHIDKVFSTQSLNKSFDPAIRASLGIAKRTLNKYYNMTDWSEVYRMAMVLHPRHKLEYFKAANWDATWIQAAEAIVQEEYERSYAQPQDNESDSESVQEVPLVRALSFSAHRRWLTSLVGCWQHFRPITSLVSPQAITTSQ